eukprot:s164_g42.t1
MGPRKRKASDIDEADEKDANGEETADAAFTDEPEPFILQTREEMKRHAGEFSRRSQHSKLIHRYRKCSADWAAAGATAQILKHAFHVAVSWHIIPGIARCAWFAFGCDAEELPVVQELAELLMQMLKSCKRQTPPPRLRVALQIAAETLEDIEQAGHEFAEAVLKEVKAMLKRQTGGSAQGSKGSRQVAVDVGAGIGIMSAMAVVHGKLGQVHAVEVLPEVARIIPKEWLGILALNEGMAQPLLRCRDALCRGPARPQMLPGWLRLWVQPGQASVQQGAGGDVTCGPRVITTEQLQGSPTLLLDLDLNTCSVNDLFESPGIDVESAGGATGLVGWFDLHCCKDHPNVVLSTSPSAPKTHWLQCWMPFAKALKGSTKLHVQVQLKPQNLAGLPELCVVLSGEDHDARFFLDRGVVEYGQVRPAEARESEPKRRRLETEDIEAIYFPSDVQELLRLAQQAVKEGMCRMWQRMQSSTSDTRELLKNITAHVRSGEVLAIIGGSGAGKTTLLDTVALEPRQGYRQGQVLLNGINLDQALFRKSCAYVAQSDACCPTLTVKETLLFAASLYQGRETLSARRRHVQSLLVEVGLDSCQHVKVGDGLLIRGVSGGQRRRVSLAVELLKRPSVLVLDEPTSGLDSKAAEAIIELLTGLSVSNNLAALCTIHQPSSYVFQLFDRLLVLAKGRICYFGRADEALAHFDSIGYPSQPGINPAEFMIHITNADFAEEGQVEQICDAWQAAKQKECRSNKTIRFTGHFSGVKMITPLHIPHLNHLICWMLAGICLWMQEKPFLPARTEVPRTKAGAGFCIQVWKLFSRFVKSNVRSPIAFAGRAVLTALLVSFVCVAYIGARDRDQENVLNYLWAIMWVQQLPAFLCIGAVPTFAREHACFRKEDSQETVGDRRRPFTGAPMAGFLRKLTINVENLSQDKCAFVFSGENFESGGWKDQRTQRITDFAALELESQSLFSGLSGYVVFSNTDHSQLLTMAFTVPITTAPCFSARCGASLHGKDLLSRVPDLARPGTGLRREAGCAWETQELTDEHVTVRLVVLPPEGAKLPEELERRLAKARYCRSVLTDQNQASTAPRMTFVERRMVLEIDNRSEENMILDGDFFDSGSWCGAKVACLETGKVSRLEFASDEVFRGLTGLMWFVSEKSLDTYFSLVFSNPLTTSATFNAWAGPPPAELLQEMWTAPPVPAKGVQVPNGQGCAWNVLEHGSVVHIRLIILEELAPMNPAAYPPREDGSTTPASPSSPQAAAAASSQDCQTGVMGAFIETKL